MIDDWVDIRYDLFENDMDKHKALAFFYFVQL